MAKGKNVKKMTREQRQTRTYRVVFIVISVIVLLTMLLVLQSKFQYIIFIMVNNDFWVSKAIPFLVSIS